MDKIKSNSQHKDRLFRLIFREKRHLLSLYNAMSGNDYEDPEELELTTLEDVIYIGMKNDVSFLLDDVLNLWEHQSSFNPNMPIRGLSYLARLYQRFIEEHRINIYSSRLQKLPLPQYVVFYNGLREEPDRLELKLSDAFFRKSGSDLLPCLEVRAVMLNINWGKNRELMEQCKQLREYAQFVARVRGGVKEGLDAEAAVNAAVDSCIQDGILREILSAHKAEVIAMFLTEYDEEKHMAMEREEWLSVGEDFFATLANRLIADFRTEELQRATSDKAYRESLYREYGIKE